MPDVVKIVTIIGQSPQSFAEAAANAVEEAAKTLRGITGGLRYAVRRIGDRSHHAARVREIGFQTIGVSDGDQQAAALSSYFEEFLRKQTDVRDRYEVLLNQHAILLQHQRDLLAMRKGMREQVQERKMLIEQ